MLRWVLKKAYTEWNRNGDSDENSKTGELMEAPVFSENSQVIMNRLSVEIWMVKTILMRPQMAIRNKLLESEGKTILVMW
jgi:hypothetical protein